jgi:hypothetical protein
MMPPGLNWPRALMDGDTAAMAQAVRFLASGPLQPGWTGIATGAPAAGLVRKIVAGLPEASALYLTHTDPLDLGDAIRHAASELQGLSVLPVDSGTSLNDGQRLVIAPGLGASRADLCSIDQWLATWSGAMNPGDLLAFTIPMWEDPAMLEARWAAANSGATVFADAGAGLVHLASAAGERGVIAHLSADGIADRLGVGGFAVETVVSSGCVLGVVARKVG